jgi:uncharacterized protein YecE (DUF72 family)
VRVRVGLAAWSNRHFDLALYPLGTPHAEYLPRYARLFDVAEADILHHQKLDATTLGQWAAQTPEGFLFLPKLSKQATHTREASWRHPQVGPPEDEGTITERFLTALEPLRAAGRLGPVLVQLAPELDRLHGWDRLQAILASAPPGTFAVEVRHPTWFAPAVERLLEDFEAPLVWSTYPGAFAPPWRTASYGYVRFTGKQRPKRGRQVRLLDRRKEVAEVARRLREASWDTCHCIVTNPFEGNAVDSLPLVAQELGLEGLADRLRRPPGQVLFPDA